MNKKRSVPYADRPASFRWQADRDAVRLLLIAFGYPSIPPDPPQSGTRRVHKAFEDNDDEEA
jgi:hypothetical protein